MSELLCAFESGSFFGILNATHVSQDIIFDDVPRGKVIQMTGPGGTGKTIFSIQLAMSVATGKDFGVFIPSPRQYKVVMVSGEDGNGDAQEKFKRILSTFKIDEDTMKTLDQNMRIVNMQGSEIKLVSQHKLGTSRTQFHQELAKLLKEFGADLLIFDSWSRAIGGSENDNIATTEAVNAFEAIAREADCAILILSHTGKGVASEYGPATQYQSRGASALVDATRKTYLMLRIDSKKNAMACNIKYNEHIHKDCVAIAPLKSNIGPLGKPLLLKMNSDGIPTRVNENDFITTDEKSLFFDMLTFIGSNPSIYTPRTLKDVRGPWEGLAAEAIKRGYLQVTSRAGVKNPTGEPKHLALTATGEQKLEKWKTGIIPTANHQNPIQANDTKANHSRLQ